MRPSKRAELLHLLLLPSFFGVCIAERQNAIFDYASVHILVHRAGPGSMLQFVQSNPF